MGTSMSKRTSKPAHGRQPGDGHQLSEPTNCMSTSNDDMISRLTITKGRVPISFSERFRSMIDNYDITTLRTLPDVIMAIIIEYVHVGTIIIVNGGHQYRSGRVRPISSHMMYNAFFDITWLPFIDYPAHHRARSHALAAIGGHDHDTLLVVGGNNSYEAIRIVPTLSMRDLVVRVTAVPSSIPPKSARQRHTTITSSSDTQWTTLIGDIPSEFVVDMDGWLPSGGMVDAHYHVLPRPSLHISYSFRQYQWYQMPALPDTPGRRYMSYAIAIDTKYVPLQPNSRTLTQLAAHVGGALTSALPSVSIGRANTALERYLHHRYQPVVTSSKDHRDDDVNAFGATGTDGNAAMVAATEAHLIMVSTNADRRLSTSIDIYYIRSSQWLSMTIPEASAPPHRYGAQTIVVPASYHTYVSSSLSAESRACQSGGYVVVLGGYDNQQQLMIRTERLSLTTYQWSACSSRWNLPSSKLSHFSAVWNGNHILLIGGELGAHKVTRNCWSLDPYAPDSTWRAAPRLPLPRTCHAATVWFG